MDVHILELVGAGLSQSAAMLWDTLWALVVGFALSGAVQAFVPRREMHRLLGGGGPLALLRATGFGAASSSCSYAAAALAKSLFKGGAGFVTAMVFMVASTNLVVELGIVLAVLIGWQFTAGELLGGVLMIGLFVVLSRWTLSAGAVERARNRLRNEADSHPGGPGTAGTQPHGWSRLRSAELWGAAAGYGLADLRMLRKEIIAGFLAAGFLAALVPASAWQALFLTGHGFASSLENALVGPLIAMLSFVCSVGNIPLAAALWKGGISFGGVASFIYADLITLPLLLIYRRYYGLALTLRLLATFWPVMAGAGLATQYLFRFLGAIPTVRPHQIAAQAWGSYSTAGLDGAALLLLLVGVLVSRRYLGRSSSLVQDPVCGMRLDPNLAPAHLESPGQNLYFCSDGCRDRFRGDPDRYR
ncbi:MAG TPA: permease [Candidatus Dormibacteraeota bacterium]